MQPFDTVLIQQAVIMFSSALESINRDCNKINWKGGFGWSFPSIKNLVRAGHVLSINVYQDEIFYSSLVWKAVNVIKYGCLKLEHNPEH